VLSWLRALFLGGRESGGGLDDATARENPDAQVPESDRLLVDATARLVAGDHAGALELAHSALDLKPESSLAHQTAGAAAVALSDLEMAADHYMLAQHFSPDSELFALEYANVLERQGRNGHAVAILEKVVSRNAGFADAGFCLARLHYAGGRYEEAVRWLEQNVKSQPRHATSLNLLGLILAREHGDLGAGEQSIRRALELAPDFQAAHSNLGWILAEQGRVDEALEHFDRVLDANAQDMETRLMRAHACLKSGRFAQGWKDFEARHFSPLAVPRQALLVDQRIDLVGGKRILICAEQGLGDQIMFASCIPDLLAKGATGAFECDQRLVGLFRRSFPSLEILSYPFSEGHPAWPKYGLAADLQIPIGSLPGLYRRSLEDFPPRAGYLRADAEKVAAWRVRYASLGPGPYVGISWRGGMSTTRQQLRTIPLSEWSGLLSMPGTFVSLQYGDCAQEISGMSDGRLHHWPESLTDYDETAAMVAAMDMVISVCTAVVHLGGALGVPVWVLTPAIPEWRYLASGERMPWYPSARLFRQAPGEPWAAVLERVGEAFRHC